MRYDLARKFIYQNARPLDLARWKFHFENGSREDVLTALAAYQNEDGGFGGALEPDCWNPLSSPIQTWVATSIVNEVGLKDRAHPIVRGILRYLSLFQDFDGHVWANAVLSNNDYPHAPWWRCDPAAAPSYNPTASLLGFILRFADENSPLYQTACDLTKEAYRFFEANCPLEAMHVAACFVDLYESVKESARPELLNMGEFRSLLDRQLRSALSTDVSTWRTSYVCKPSLFIKSKASDFYLSNQALCERECQFIEETQEPDGTWSITWAWGDYPEQWSISKNWWKADWILKYSCFLCAMRA